jgi:hypothetical protein
LPKFSQRQRYTLAVLCSLLIAGLVLLSYPSPTEENIATYSTPPNLSTNYISQEIAYALNGYYATAHVIAGNTVTVTLTLIESDLVIFKGTFPAGTFDIPNTPITAANGGTVFLTVASQNQVFTQINVVARVFQIVTGLPFFWAGVGVLGFAGLLTLAVFYQHTAAGKLARRILPVEKAGLGWP